MLLASGWGDEEIGGWRDGGETVNCPLSSLFAVRYLLFAVKGERNSHQRVFKDFTEKPTSSRGRCGFVAFCNFETRRVY
ncbi:hypothetical protein CKA32_002741 [Geitlerinema sp. FC II]|nr:hypothetical protein CKA32_002741 [Geitlerinema sp. FC II]